jgi:hypothetical protein
MSSSILEQQKRSLSDSVLDADCMYETEDGQLVVPCVLHNIDVAVGTTSICECVLGGAPVAVIAYRYVKRGGVYIAYVGCSRVAHRTAALFSACPMCLGEILAAQCRVSGEDCRVKPQNEVSLAIRVLYQ